MITLYRRGTIWSGCTCDKEHTDTITLKPGEMFRVCAGCGAPLGIKKVGGHICPCHAITHGMCDDCAKATLKEAGITT